MGFMVQAGWPTLRSGGLYYRINTFPTGPVRVGHQIEAGGLWFGYSLPIAIPLNDSLWLTTQPSLRASALSIVQLPVGLSVQSHSGKARLDLEFGAHFGVAGDNDYIPGYNTMLYGGLGISHQFGKSTKPFRKTTRGIKKSQLLSSGFESLKEAKGTPTEHLVNTTVSSENPFYLKCKTVGLKQYTKTAHVYVEKEQDCTFMQKGRSHPFSLQPGSNMVCGNWSGSSIVRCVPVTE
jgi:hypothetical protein